MTQVMPAIILVYASMLPQEIRISLADLAMFPWRLAGIAVLPWVILNLRRNPIRLRGWDFAIVLSAFWIVFSFTAYYGPGSGLVRGAALAIDVVIPYLIGRASIRTTNDLRVMLIMVAPGLALAGLFMFLEAMVSRPLVRPAVASVFGDLPVYEGGVISSTEGSYTFEKRLGLLRAAGPFAHPILAGLFLASFLPLYLQSGLRRWPLFLGVLACFLSFFSLSSGPYLLLLIGIALVAFDWLQSKTTFMSWGILIPAALLAATVAHFGSEGGLVNIISRFTLDPRTAYFRELIWEYGIQSVLRNPWIGIGFDSYERLPWMVSSVDSHWLLLAIRHGPLPAFAMVTAAIWIIVELARASLPAAQVDRRLLRGLAIALFGTCLLGLAVAFFGGFQTWFFILFGMAGALAANSRVAASQGPQRVQIPVVARSRGHRPQVAARGRGNG